MSLDNFKRLDQCISGLGLVLFPNPTDQVLFLKSNSDSDTLSRFFRLDLIDTFGRKVFEYLASPDDSNKYSISISIDHLPPGIYLATLYGKQNQQTVRVAIR